ncbi:MAG: HEAT repeat domain-containing protein [Polyangiales bacterium]
MILSKARPSTPDAVLRDLGSKDVRARVAAAEHAARLAPSEGERSKIVSALTRALQDEAAEVRGAAALALADLDASEALPALLVAADDDAFVVRQLAITALGEIGDARAQQRVLRALSDSRPEVRFQAIVAYPRIAGADDDVWSALADALKDDDAHVRGRAAEACAELADGKKLPAAVADRLAAIVDDEKEPADARVAAAIALGESGDARGERVFLAVMDGKLEEQDPQRIQAIFELAGELGLKAAIPLASNAAFGLRARFGDPSKRASALVALVRLGDRRAIDFVLAEMNGTASFERRTLAIGIAARAAMTEARPHLEALRKDPLFREAAEDALAMLPRS